MERIKRVHVTDESRQVIERLRSEHGVLMFHQNGGCCDGFSPRCYRLGERKRLEPSVKADHKTNTAVRQHRRMASLVLADLFRIGNSQNKP